MSDQRSSSEPTRGEEVAPQKERSPIDQLFTVAGVCALGDRSVLPKESREQLHAAAEAANADEDRLVFTDEAGVAEDLLMHAAFAVVAYPNLPDALDALRAAYRLVSLLRAPDPSPAPGQTWEQKTGLVG